MACNYPGVSPPVSLKESDKTQEQHSMRLIDTINQMDVFANKPELEKRTSILRKIEDIVIEWVLINSQRKLKLQSLKPENIFGAKVIPFGGQAIGVVRKGGDLDALCVVPKFLTREDFFTGLPNMLQQIDGLIIIRKVEGAYVPVIQLSIQDVSVDLSLAILRYEKISADLVYTDDSILTAMDEVSIRSLSGVRDAELLLSLVPHQQNFISTLKIIKIWASSTQLHNSALGYPGGIAWAVMVARVCQMYPLATVSVLVHKFFIIFSQWKWPQPVLLRELLDQSCEKALQWNPKVNPADRHHLMPVITPGFPEHNCTLAVNKSSRDVIRKQLSLAANLCEQIHAEKEDWKILFKPIDFFHLYKHFLIITARAVSKQGFLDWSGFIESRIRKLVESLESQRSIQHLHLYTKAFTKRENFSRSWFIGLRLNKSECNSLDLSSPMTEFAENVKKVAQERNIWAEDMKIEVKHVPRKQIEVCLSQYDPI